MSETLYDEAIADAKKLREVAEQNAKNAIIEAVTPKIREFIEEQLVSESSESDDFQISRDALDEDEDVLNSLVSDMLSDTAVNEDTEMEFVLDEEALSALMELLSDSDQGSDNSALAKKISETFEKLSDDESKKILSAVQKLTKNNNLSSSVINNNMLVTEESKDMSQTGSDEVYYDVDLDALLEAVDERSPSRGRGRKVPAEPEPGQEVLEDLDELQYDEAGIDTELQEILASLSDDTDLNEAVLEIDVGDVEINDELRDALSRATVSVVDEEEEEGEDVELEEPDEDGEPEDLDMDLPPLPAEDEPFPPEGEALEEIFEIDEEVLKRELLRLRGIAEKRHVVKSKVSNASAINERLRKESRKNRALNHKLAEYRSAVETLRGQLSEMNLFNAKLLYVNKLLQRKGVSDEQRKTVIESLDNARSLREVKLLYKSLVESMGNRSGTISESAVRRSVGSSSRATRSASSDASAPREVDRWAKLAGIK